jgi:hypothetical protein
VRIIRQRKAAKINFIKSLFLNPIREQNVKTRCFMSTLM